MVGSFNRHGDFAEYFIVRHRLHWEPRVSLSESVCIACKLLADSATISRISNVLVWKQNLYSLSTVLYSSSFKIADCNYSWASMHKGLVMMSASCNFVVIQRIWTRPFYPFTDIVLFDLSHVTQLSLTTGHCASLRGHVTTVKCRWK